MAVFIFTVHLKWIKLNSTDSFFEGRKKSGAGFTIEAGILAGAQSSQVQSAIQF